MDINPGVHGLSLRLAVVTFSLYLSHRHSFNKGGWADGLVRG